MKALIIGTAAVGCAVAIATINGGMETALLARKKLLITYGSMV